MRMLVAVVVLGTPLALCAGEPPDLRTRKTGADWPAFLGPNGNGTSSETGIITRWPRNGLRVLWQARLGLGYAPPAISRGRLFHVDAFLDRERKANFLTVTCRNSESGRELWRFDYPTDYDDYFGYDNGPRCAPVVDGDRLYIMGVEGMLHCLRAEDGKLLWKVDTRLEYSVLQNFFGAGSSPVVEGDVVIAAVGGSPKGTPAGLDDFLARKGNGTGLVAFDKETGKEKWRVSNELASYSSPIVTTLAGERVGLYFARGGLVGFDPKAGQQLFHFPWRSRLLESANASNPVVVGDSVLLSECYGPGSAFLRIQQDRPTEIWTDADKGRDKSLKCHWNTPIHHGGFVYGCSGRHTSDAELRCIELATGKLRWRQRGLTRSSLLMVDGHFLCLCEDGLLLLLKVNPGRYEEVARWDLGEANLLDYPCWAAPILSHGLLYVRGKERLLCLELIPEQK